MTSIPASEFVRGIPGVLNAGGTALQTGAVVLTKSTRVPIGTVLSFPSANSVATFFGANSIEAEVAGGGTNLGTGYFGGFINATQTPAELLFTQFNEVPVPAYLMTSPVDGYTIPQLQGLSGALSIVMDGYTYSNGSVSLSAATSYSSAADIIQTALNASLPSGASFTASASQPAANITGSIAGNVLTITQINSGNIAIGEILQSGAASGTQIQAQLTGDPLGIGTYSVSIAQELPSTAMSSHHGLLTVTGTPTGAALAVGQLVAGVGVTAGTTIFSLGTGTGAAGTYVLNKTIGIISSEAMTTTAPSLAVTYDSVSGAIVITSGSIGVQSTAAFATGSLAAPIFATAATGATLSQGAAPSTPAAFMTALTETTQDWVSFMTAFDPDGNSSGGNVQKQNFAAWNNGQDDRYVYVCFDTDVTPTISNNASSSLGQILMANETSGTFLIWEPSNYNYASFVCGMIASINYNVTNGRITLAYKGQTGLVATVTTQTVYENLKANGYNCYCDVATAAQNFVFLQPGTITGPFEWCDSYVDQIVLNNALQLALMELETNVNSIPYNAFGYGLVVNAMQDPIQAALNSGIIRKGVQLSNLQAALVNEAAGGNVAPVIQQEGYVIVIQPASPQTRQARQSPGIFLWYTDGESIQQLVFNSILIQ